MSTKAAPVTEDISIGGIDEGIDLDSKATLQPNLSEEELEKQKRMEEYREELTKIQEDISTLRLVLNDKLKRENELKTLLGISFITEMKQDISAGLNTVKSTSAFSSIKLSFQQVAQTFSELGASVSQNDALPVFSKVAKKFFCVSEINPNSIEAEPLYPLSNNVTKEVKEEENDPETLHFTVQK